MSRLCYSISLRPISLQPEEIRPSPWWRLAVLVLLGVSVAGCDNGMKAIDRKTLDLLASRTEGINAEVVPRWPRPEPPPR